MVADIIISIIWLSVSCIFKSLMDFSEEGRFSNPWWNKRSENAWLNKWKLDAQGKQIPYTGKPQAKYLWLFTPTYVERFYLSSTALVFLTDGWHLLQFFFLSIIALPVAIYAYPSFGRALVVYLCARAAMGLYFTTHRRVFLKSN